MEKIVMVISDGTVIDVIAHITGKDNPLIIFIGFVWYPNIVLVIS